MPKSVAHAGAVDPLPVFGDVAGGHSDDFNRAVLTQAAQANSDYLDPQRAPQSFEATMAAMKGMAPRSEIQGMIAAQILAVHNLTMECARRVMTKNQSLPQIQVYLKATASLSRTCAELVAALGRLQGTSQQKVTVEHVHVHAGGQAIVGSVASDRKGGLS